MMTQAALASLSTTCPIVFEPVYQLTIYMKVLTSLERFATVPVWNPLESVISLLFYMTTCIYRVLFSAFQTTVGVRLRRDTVHAGPGTEELKYLRVEVLKQRAQIAL